MMSKQQWILTTTCLILINCLSGCSSTWFKDEGCPSCFHDYQARYTIHGCHTAYDQTCWVNCNTCQQTPESAQKNYWHDSVNTVSCRQHCCEKQPAKKNKIYKD